MFMTTTMNQTINRSTAYNEKKALQELQSLCHERLQSIDGNLVWCLHTPGWFRKTGHLTCSLAWS